MHIWHMMAIIAAIAAPIPAPFPNEFYPLLTLIGAVFINFIRDLRQFPQIRLVLVGTLAHLTTFSQIFTSASLSHEYSFFKVLYQINRPYIV